MLAAVLVLVALSTVVSNVFAKDTFILLEVDKPEDKSVQDYKDLLKGIDIMHFFQTIGSSKLRIVVKINETSAKELSKKTLPGEVKSIPAGDMADKMESLGVIWKRYPMALPSVNLTLFERTLNLTGEPYDHYLAFLKAYGESLKPLLEKHQYHGLFHLGATPPKGLLFINLPRTDIDLASDIGIDVLGGPGDSVTKVEFLVNV